MKVYSDQLLTKTQEYFFRHKPSLQSRFVTIIASLIAIAFIWFAVAPFEEVIKTSGFIRPETNISSVSNVITGKITKVEYSMGKAVKKGDLLLSIDPTQILKEKETLITELEKQKEKLIALNYINESIEKGKNVIPNEYQEATLRFQKWQKNINQLEKTKNNNLYILNLEKSLPANMTTETRLKEYTYKYKVSLDEYNAFNTSFKHDIAHEIEELELSTKLNETKLEQIEDSLRYTDVTAPIDGLIQEISVLNPGDWIQSGQKLFNIVPYGNENCIVELSVPASQAGKIKHNMKVKMRFPSLPYYEFGGAEGCILTIAPDISSTSNGTAVFVIRSNMDKNVLVSKSGINFPLRIGLQVDARIIVSKRTLLKYVLEKLNLWY
ncbi:MAG: HlyD family efflux transporter periplasmic adaptor subunit [Treponema sp.]|nr:HlyD family efflux transporter periplasmic adaptor subunit [Treponema sp.]